MSALGEKTLMLLLTDTDSVEVMIRQGLNALVVPTVPFRDVVVWSLAHYQQTGVAPTIDVLKERFGTDMFTDQQINLDEDVEETIEWAIDDLNGTWIQQQIGLFTRRLATEVNAAPPEQRLDALAEKASELSGMVLSLQPKVTHVDIREQGPAILAEYEMAASHDGVQGMRIGLPEIDSHFGGIRNGEMFVVGGPAGTGKSFFADWVIYNEWQRGRCSTLFTLENSISMTQMRIACCALRLSTENLQNGTLEPAEVERLREWCNDVLVNSETPLNIINPEMVNRSPQALIQAARAYETESLVVDQLTHVAAVDPRARDKRNEEVATIVRTLGDLISSGRSAMPLLLLHQINREGIKEAASTGKLKMTHFAESSEIERTAAVATTLYQSDEQRMVNHMELQTLKVRRVQPRDFTMNWQPWNGLIYVADDVDFGNVLSTAPAPAAQGVPA